MMCLVGLDGNLVILRFAWLACGGDIFILDCAWLVISLAGGDNSIVPGCLCLVCVGIIYLFLCCSW